MDILCCALALLGSVVGAGFASGREIVRFFAAHGAMGFVAVAFSLAALAALFLCLAERLSEAQQADEQNGRQRAERPADCRQTACPMRGEPDGQRQRDEKTGGIGRADRPNQPRRAGRGTLCRAERRHDGGRAARPTRGGG